MLPGASYEAPSLWGEEKRRKRLFFSPLLFWRVRRIRRFRDECGTSPFSNQPAWMMDRWMIDR